MTPKHGEQTQLQAETHKKHISKYENLPSSPGSIYANGLEYQTFACRVLMIIWSLLLFYIFTN